METKVPILQELKKQAALKHRGDKSVVDRKMK